MYAFMPINQIYRYSCTILITNVSDNLIIITYIISLIGRCDDTMNLGGIKVSSVEIERVCNQGNDIYY